LRRFNLLRRSNPVTTQQIRIDIQRAALGGRPTVEHASSDQALIERIASGDKLAMRALFARHHVRVYRFILRLVRDETLAEDLIGEVFLDVWRQAASFKALSLLRRKGGVALDEETARKIEDTADNPEAAIERKQRSEILRRCWSTLSPQHRDIIDLVYYQEKTIAEVAAIVGVPENTVKTRMFYARKHLAQLLKGAGLDRA